MCKIDDSKRELYPSETPPSFLSLLGWIRTFGCHGPDDTYTRIVIGSLI